MRAYPASDADEWITKGVQTVERALLRLASEVHVELEFDPEGEITASEEKGYKAISTSPGQVTLHGVV